MGHRSETSGLLTRVDSSLAAKPQPLRLNQGGSHHTGKFIVVVLETGARRKRSTASGDAPPALKQNALTLFQSARRTAASRAQSVAAELHVDFGGIGVKSDVKIVLKSVEETAPDPTSNPTTTLRLEWEAATMSHLFPLMRGVLSAYPLTSTETQLDFFGVYKPPFGAVGKIMNAIVGHRIAEASVHRFVNDVAGYLRQTLA